jgi:hypothetical protein
MASIHGDAVAPHWSAAIQVDNSVCTSAIGAAPLRLPAFCAPPSPRKHSLSVTCHANRTDIAITSGSWDVGAPTTPGYRAYYIYIEVLFLKVTVFFKSYNIIIAPKPR